MIYYGNELYHHGIKGQKWGDRNYQYEDGSLTPEGKRRYGIGDKIKSFGSKVGNKIKTTAQTVGNTEVGGKVKVAGKAVGNVAKTTGKTFQRSHFNRDKEDKKNYKALLKNDRRELKAIKKEVKKEFKGDRRAAGKAYRDRAIEKIGTERVNNALASQKIRMAAKIGAAVVAAGAAIKVASIIGFGAASRSNYNYGNRMSIPKF